MCRPTKTGTKSGRASIWSSRCRWRKRSSQLSGWIQCRCRNQSVGKQKERRKP
uniref:BLTX687 n=1 Tax=Nephila pilipes TaxID=299642 RepID=A0A076KVI1_NEPPI|nr:BLTX687 [Nephila pilipes]